MKIILRNIGLLILIILSESCSDENLNGHYHLEWGNGNQFQVWNIKDNKMVINREVCADRDDDCFSSQIRFKGDKMFIEPWVDINYECKYSIEENGTISMKDGRIDMKLIPHFDCKSNQEYFSEKIQNYTKSNQFIIGSMTGEAALPSRNKNELLIFYSKENEETNVLFNGNMIEKLSEIVKSNEETIWLTIEKSIELNEIIPILIELKERGYKPYFSALSKRENNEQIQLISRNIESIIETDKGYEIDICEFCEKHQVTKIDSILKIEIIEPERYFIQGDTVDLFQTRNRIARYLGMNRTSRLNTQIEFYIPEQTNFENYFRLMDEINFVHISISDITFYKGKDDLDASWIRKKQENYESDEILDEFPIRIKEIIKKKTAKNNVYDVHGG